MSDVEDSVELDILPAFDFDPRTRVVFGSGSLLRLGEIARELNMSRVLLVTDPGIERAGHAGRAMALLREAGIDVNLFDAVQQNPTTDDVERGLQFAKEHRVDSIVAIGGGSAMDCAKGINFLLTNGGRMSDYWGIGKASRPMLPLLAIPTTAGTGSECQSAALIVDEQTHQKMACLDPKAVARAAILDPALTLSQPPRVAAATGIDAIAHAVETAVTKKRNPLSLMFSHESFKLSVKSLPEILMKPKDLEARGRMLLGAALAGLAIENSMLGAAHAAANPLTAHYGIVHGQAVGLMLPAVIRFNAEDPESEKIYKELASASNSADGHHAVSAKKLVEKIEGLLGLAKMPRSLSHAGVARESIPILAEEAAQQWTATFNPRQLTTKDFESLYTQAFGR